MNSLGSKLLISAVFFIFIFIFGFWLSRSGKPYSSGLLTVHKLIGLAAGIFLGWSVYQLAKVEPISPIGIAATVVTVLFFLGLVVTGGLLSIDKPMPVFVSLIHKTLPYLAVLSTGATIFLLFW